jgi:DNA-3-methyladenine glycosylase II
MFTIEPRGPFSLAAAAEFWAGFPPAGQPDAADGPVLRLAFLLDSLDGADGVALRQRDGGVSADAPDALRAQVERILSLDVDGTGFEQVGERDPVIGALMRAKPGLRPVLYPTPYEAAAWAVLSARVRGAQALALRRRLMEEHGTPVEVAGETLPTFPAPASLLALDEVPGLPAQKLERLHGVARAALDGALDAAALRAMEPAEALERLRGIHGIGPFFAELILLRGTGFPDVMPLAAPRIRAEVASAYGLAGKPDDARLLEIAEAWRPFRSWVCLLLRAA